MGCFNVKGRIVVGRDEVVRKEILLLFHTSALGENLGVMTTHQRVYSVVYYKGLKRESENL